MNRSLEDRLLNLEDYIPGIPGTSLTRVLAKDHGIEWCLGIGRLLEPKEFFYGSSIEECLEKAESFFLNL